MSTVQPIDTTANLGKLSRIANLRVIRWVFGSYRQVAQFIADRAALVAFKVNAARCGLTVRKCRLQAETIGFEGLVAGVIGAVLSLASLGIIGWFLHTFGPIRRAWHYHPQITIAIIAFAIGVILCGLVLRLGNLSRIMYVASKSEDGAEAVRAWMATGMKNLDAYAKLRDLYRSYVEAANEEMRTLHHWLEPFQFVDVIDNEGVTHKYAAVAMPLSDPTNLNNILTLITPEDAPDPEDFSDIAENRQRLMKKLRRDISDLSRRNIEEGENYYLLSVGEKDGGLRLGVNVARYGQILRSCDSLINEFALFAYISRGQCKKMRPGSVLKCLPWRRETHKRSKGDGDVFLRPYDRAAGLGIAVATVLADSGDFRVGLGMRSAQVGTYPDCLHVVPAGMCNTHGSEHMRQQNPVNQSPPGWYLKTTMQSEFVEEWYNDERLEKAQMPNWREEVDKKWDQILRGREISITGLAFDLLNLRPEICGEVVVRSWGDELCWEYVAGKAQHEEQLFSPRRHIRPTHIVQSGAAAIYLAQRCGLADPIEDADPVNLEEKNDHWDLSLRFTKKLKSLVSNPLRHNPN
ncbi:hypothetical protein ABZV24_43105 [Streptomyces sp. NPDC005251]|uniref:hypothetical protein n=1 Tax=Streptomyces sp. NPDC005251 TaxID=3157166 RepID=UPI0033AF2DDA